MVKGSGVISFENSHPEDKILKSEYDQDKNIEKNGTIYKWKEKKLHITTY